MFRFPLFVTVFALVSFSANSNERESVNSVLDRLHHSASQANGDSYFSIFSERATYIGTDPTETWTLEQFKGFAVPYFNKGKGWTYVARDRHIYFSKNKDTAWFDEMLDNDKYGETRGTGVLVKSDHQWKIVQYHLTLPIPNELTNDVVKMIKPKP
jgi:hypothetical protein